ncbi:vWA domain-containing protein [Spirosoma rhododendri]|uniref:VWA domain-containing protein n=1 Tax=Spirosoma rhododendri TaxID=2728024 RepID=A0A7L5DR05_9BACT|nr:VWA domain-containing protein [Spirosoma rhododendri]QJD80575.1 VWA domain-containing protein [Spirosoma rhododendri]
MFLDFFLLLRQHAIPVTVPEYLTLLAALRSDVGGSSIDGFYALSKTILVKHEQQLDLFDRLFEQYINQRDAGLSAPVPVAPPDWFTQLFDRSANPDDLAAVDAAGGSEALWTLLRDQLERPPVERLNGAGDNDGDLKSGQGDKPDEQGASNKQEGALKVWENRDYRNLDDGLELNTRNLKMALRQLRILTREGAKSELDINSTISQTSRNAGMLDIRMQPVRQNRVKVLLLLDVGGSMDDHIELCSHLFSAARYQFQQLEFFYFHNCVYETLWRDNTRRRERVPTYEVLHKYNRDYKVIFVGDASMSPYELTSPKGSVEHYNEEAGLVWLERFRQQYPSLVWLNPATAGHWRYSQSIQLIRDWSGNRMFPLTLNGLEQAMKSLKNPKVVFDE